MTTTDTHEAVAVQKPVVDLTSAGPSDGDPTRQWWRLSTWPLRIKVTAILALPVILAVILGVNRIVADLQNVGRSTGSNITNIVLQPSQNVAAATNSYVLAIGTPEEPARAQDLESAEKAMRSLTRQAIGNPDVSSPIMQALQASAKLRADVAGRSVTWVQDASDDVATINQNLLASLTNGWTDAPRDLLAQAQASSGASTAVLKQRIVLTQAATAAALSPVQRTDLTAQLNQAIGTEVAEVQAGQALGQFSADQLHSLVVDAQARSIAFDPDAGGKVAALTITANDDANTILNARSTSITKIHDFVVERLRSDRSQALVFTGLFIGGLLLALTLAMLIARSLIEGVNQLRRGAQKAATTGIPDALAAIRSGAQPAPAVLLDTGTAEELGQLARSVDFMHTTARDLALEQARLRTQVGRMFQTLSRRNNSLVNQQLSLIENLERDEEDPDRLNNLFKLDHIAARMRRNGENLMVLAEADPGDRTGAADLPLNDVLQAAVGEVEAYQRVSIAETLPLTVSAAASLDLIHLLAELLSNALTFSPPTSGVVINSYRAVEAGALLEITDSGIGMSDADLDTSNRQLKLGGEVTAETARRMGLFVVGRLARAHGLAVTLRHGESGVGVVASIYLPSSVLVTGSSRPGRAHRVGAASATEPFPAPARQVNGGHLHTSGLSITAIPAGAGQGNPGLISVPGGTTASGLPRRIRPGALPSGAAEADAVIDDRPTIQQPNDSGPERSAGPVVGGLPRRTPGGSGAGETDVSVPLASLPSSPAFGRHAGPARASNTSAFFAARSNLAAERNGNGGKTTPIFDDLASRWLSTGIFGEDKPWSSAADQGWQAVERAQSAQPVATTAAGLPSRNPGALLVPGSVEQAEQAPTRRDAERMRQTLSKHMSGVARGRSESGRPAIRTDEQ